MKSHLYLLVTIILVLFISCSKDQGVAPKTVKSTIEGTITFTGEWHFDSTYSSLEDD